MADQNGTETLAKATPRAGAKRRAKAWLAGHKIVRRMMKMYIEKADGASRMELLSAKDMPRLYRKGFTRAVRITYDMPSGRVVREVAYCLACGGVTHGGR